MRGRTAVVASVLAVAIAVAACGSDPEPPEVSSPLAACPAASAPPAGTTPATSGPLAGITLPCFTGGGPVTLNALGRPAVINLWASYCGPCRTELPELQRFADGTPGVVVLGVVTGDQRSAAASLVGDLGVSFPSVFDPDRRLLRALGRSNLPVTLFVDAAGVVRHEDISGALTAARLGALAGEHLGLS